MRSGGGGPEAGVAGEPDPACAGPGPIEADRAGRGGIEVQRTSSRRA